MNRRIFKKTGFGLKLPVALGVFALAGGFPAFALAQKESPSPAPADTVQLGAGIGGAGYAVPSNVYVPLESVENPMDAGISVHTDLVLPGEEWRASRTFSNPPGRQHPGFSRLRLRRWPELCRMQNTRIESAPHRRLERDRSGGRLR
jgi:hypothetical protein